jgi:hypothetical protein
MSESAKPSEVRECAERLLAALERFRNGLARDGGEPLRDPEDLGGTGDRPRNTAAAACLLQRADELENMAGRQRRRIELVERAVDEEGVERELAEEAYDLAREEGLEPAFGLELVRCGVAVCEPPDSDLGTTAAVKGHPEWLEPPVPRAEATRERRLRMSFRRLRSLLEERDTPEEALVAFATEPDVAECEF